MRGQQSREIGQHSVEHAFQAIDPRTSREAAWQAVERGFISPDPSFGAGLDEFDFPAAVSRNAGGFHSPTAAGFNL